MHFIRKTDHHNPCDGVVCLSFRCSFPAKAQNCKHAKIYQELKRKSEFTCTKNELRLEERKGIVSDG